MSDATVAAAEVVAVLLADGWHRVVQGSFSVGALSFGGGAGPGVPGFRLEEADIGSPYRPASLVGPLDSIVAVRQVTSARQTRELGPAPTRVRDLPRDEQQRRAESYLRTSRPAIASPACAPARG